MTQPRPAPEWRTTTWFNTRAPLALADLRGRVVMVCAFQMLCPGCVSHGLPQAQRAAETFRSDDVAVIGLHTVFEHHDAMAPKALEAFLHEYRIRFPVGVDEPNGAGIPRTMAAYQMRGTPTTLLIDRQGLLRSQAFGQVPDMQLGAEIMALMREPALAGAGMDATGCSPDGCS